MSQVLDPPRNITRVNDCGTSEIRPSGCALRLGRSATLVDHRTHGAQPRQKDIGIQFLYLGVLPHSAGQTLRLVRAKSVVHDKAAEGFLGCCRKPLQHAALLLGEPA